MGGGYAAAAAWLPVEFFKACASRQAELKRNFQPFGCVPRFDASLDKSASRKSSLNPWAIDHNP